MFHGLSFGKTGQAPITGLPANASPGGAAGRIGRPRKLGAGSVKRTVRGFAQRLPRHARTP